MFKMNIIDCGNCVNSQLGSKLKLKIKLVNLLEKVKKDDN